MRRSKNQPYFAKKRRVKYQLYYQLVKRGLPSLLRHADRNSMAFSIENRVPFLTPDLVSYMMTLPENFFVSDQGETKTLFRKAISNFVPHEITYRRDKIGYETPEKLWVDALIPKLKSKLQDENNSGYILSNRHILDLIIDYEKGGNTISNDFIWRVYNFITWYGWLTSVTIKKAS